MSNKYEGVVGSYSFMMTEPDVIEVWGEYDNENPEAFIFVQVGNIDSQKDFEKEIAFWYMNNVG